MVVSRPFCIWNYGLFLANCNHSDTGQIRLMLDMCGEYDASNYNEETKSVYKNLHINLRWLLTS